MQKKPQKDAPLAGKRILIIQQRNWSLRVGHFLAKRFAAEGCRLAAVTYKKSVHEFHRTQQEVKYDILVSNDAVYENPGLYLDGEPPATLAEICNALGITSVWSLLSGARHITHSYEEKYYFAGRQQFSDERIVQYLQGAYAYVKKIFNEFKPDAVIAPLIIEPSHWMIYHLAKMRGVRTFFHADSKLRGLTLILEHPFESEGAFFDRVDALNAGAESLNRGKARTYITEFRERFKEQTYTDRQRKRLSLWKRVRQELAPYRRILEWYRAPCIDCVKPLGPTLDCRPPRIILRDHYTKLFRAHAADRFPYVPFESVKNGNYAYYPLQYQPEQTIDVFAVHFANQLELAKQIAMSLPGDYTLVVKDHPAMRGLRSLEFLKDLAGTPNIKLIDYRTPTDQVLKHAGLVLAPNSTSLVEAAFYGIPAIQFGDQGTPQKMPNVLRHTDLTTLEGVIAERIGKKFGGPDYERRLENYVAAVYDTGYEVDYMAAWEDARTDEHDVLWRMYKESVVRALSLNRHAHPLPLYDTT
jgi:hypothetical protein